MPTPRSPIPALPLLVLTATAGGCSSSLGPQPPSLPLDTLARVALATQDATVILRDGPELTLDTSASWRGRRDAPTVAHTLTDTGTRLLLEGLCPDDARMCALTHTLTVPAHVDLTLDMQGGTLDLGDLQGRVGGELVHATLTGTGFAGRATLDTRGTAIALTDLGPARLDLSAQAPDPLSPGARDAPASHGGAVVTFADRPRSLVLHTDGAAHAEVPAGPYRLDLSARAGLVAADDTLFHTDDADALLSIRAEAGMVRVVGR